MSKPQCPRCLCYFSRPQRLKSHLNRKNRCEIINPNYNRDSEQKIFGIKKNIENQKKKSKFVSKNEQCEQNEQICEQLRVVKSKVLCQQPSTVGKIPINRNKHKKNLPNENSQGKKFVCPYCLNSFTRKFNLDRHMKSYCKESLSNDILDDQLELSSHERVKPKKKTIRPESSSGQNGDSELLNSLALKIKELEQKLEDNYTELRDKPASVHNNILQVVCVGGNQNYLDMLTEQWGDYDRALDFIRDCALSHITGDCKLLQKIYFAHENEAPIKYLDKSRNKLEYLNEKQERIVDHHGQKLGRILANNLQNTYLKGVN